MKKRLWIFGGSLALGLGIVGMLVPVLPTTPFLLLAAYCYMRGSRRLYDWLMGNRLFGAYIRNYIQYRAVSKTVKISSLIMLWVSLCVSFLLLPNTAVRIVLLLVGAGVSIHLLTLKTIPKQPPDSGAETPDP